MEEITETACLLSEQATILCSRCDREAIAIDRTGNPLCTAHANFSITLARELKSRSNRNVNA